MPRPAAKAPKGTKKDTKASEYYRKQKKSKYTRKTPRAPLAAASSTESFGESAGKLLGGLAQKAIKALTGFGEYTTPGFGIKQNVLIEHGDPPTVQNAGKEFIVRHREYLGDIYSGVAGAVGAPAASPFTIQAFPINPGLQLSFPWLANLAARFEEYELQGMLYEYKSMYSDAAVQTGGSLGTVIMATSYNAAKPNFPSKIEMENYEFAQSAKPSVSMIHPIECQPGQNVFNSQYIRLGPLLDGEDIKTYDAGKFQIASQGIPVSGSALSLGELWSTYQICFRKPKVTNYIDSGYARLSQTAAVQPAGGSPFAPLISWSTITDNIGIKLVNERTFTLPLFNNTRTYQINLICGDPNNLNTQAAAVGYFPTTATNVTNGVISIMPQIPSPAFTQATGSLNISSSAFLLTITTNPISPGQTLCTVQLPNGCGATLSYIKNLIINAVPTSS
ncbi:capsid protein [Crucivirus-234]|nr:capsid protein [Crucivirus-211]QMW68720.1 capsid protein [Crucivirus-234]